MKTLKITEETHQRLTEIKAKTRSKTLDETINILANVWCYSLATGKHYGNSKKQKKGNDNNTKKL